MASLPGRLPNQAMARGGDVRRGVTLTTPPDRMLDKMCMPPIITIPQSRTMAGVVARVHPTGTFFFILDASLQPT